MGRISTLSLLFGLMLLPTFLFAQFNNNTTSPYSRYGLGDLRDYAFGRTSAMGGAAIASRYNMQINLANPASYNAIDSLGFMFEIGIDGRGSRFSTTSMSATANDFNFQYFAMNFRVGNGAGAVLGLKPFSDVGYDVSILEDVENVGQTYTRYFGSGTISKAFIGLAVKPLINFSIGANLNYTFGLLERNAIINFLEDYDYYLVQQRRSQRISDFSFDFGAQATIPFGEKQKIIIGAVIENNPKYNGFSSDLTIMNISYGSTGKQDTLNPKIETEEKKGFIEYPLSYGIGISYVKDDVLEINADYFHQSWSQTKIFGEESSFLTDLNKFALGGEWVPDKFSIRGYLNRVLYRGGITYKQSYLKFGNEHIDDIGITFGVGLPIYRSNSTINVAAELGRRGTKNNNLVLEKYARLNVSINLFDFWFIKRKFD